MIEYVLYALAVWLGYKYISKPGPVDTTPQVKATEAPSVTEGMATPPATTKTTPAPAPPISAPVITPAVVAKETALAVLSSMPAAAAAFVTVKPVIVSAPAATTPPASALGISAGPTTAVITDTINAANAAAFAAAAACTIAVDAANAATAAANAAPASMDPTAVQNARNKASAAATAAAAAKTASFAASVAVDKLNADKTAASLAALAGVTAAAVNAAAAASLAADLAQKSINALTASTVWAPVAPPTIIVPTASTKQTTSAPDVSIPAPTWTTTWLPQETINAIKADPNSDKTRVLCAAYIAKLIPPNEWNPLRSNQEFVIVTGLTLVKSVKDRQAPNPVYIVNPGDILIRQKDVDIMCYPYCTKDLISVIKSCSNWHVTPDTNLWCSPLNCIGLGGHVTYSLGSGPYAAFQNGIWIV